MPNQFTGSIVGDLETYFINDYATIDQFANTGSLWMWGQGGNGNLGDNTIAAKSSPVQTIAAGINWKQVSAGGSSAGIKTDGTLWTWGFGANGELGTNATANRSSPGQTISAGTNWKQVSCGVGNTHAIKTDGTLWSWGVGIVAGNTGGANGNNSTASVSSPVQTVAAGTNWKYVSGGKYFVGAIKTDGTLWMWGNNLYGNLGNNSTASRSSPVQTVSGGTNWKYIDCGGNFAAGIKTDGTLWLWGNNGYGQLGNNNINNLSSPVQTIAGGTNWKQVACSGVYHAAAIKTDGTLWLWGQNNYAGAGNGGRLGDNTLVDRSSPVQTVAGGTNWKQVGTGQEHTAAIKTDGTLWLWGRGSYAQLAANNLTSTSSPSQSIAAGTNWKQLSVACNTQTNGAIYFYDANNLYPK